MLLHCDGSGLPVRIPGGLSNIGAMYSKVPLVLTGLAKVPRIRFRSLFQNPHGLGYEEVSILPKCWLFAL